MLAFCSGAKFKCENQNCSGLMSHEEVDAHFKDLHKPSEIKMDDHPNISGPRPYTIENKKSKGLRRSENQEKCRINRQFNAFAIFEHEKALEYRKKGQKMPGREISKMIGVQWKKLTKEEQKKYYNLAEAEREKHIQRMAIKPENGSLLITTQDHQNQQPFDEHVFEQIKTGSYKNVFPPYFGASSYFQEEDNMTQLLPGLDDLQFRY